MKFVGWTTAILVLLGVLTAWIDPSSGGLMHAAVLTLAAIWALYALIRRATIPVHWIVLLPLGCAVLGILQITLNWTVYPYETWNSVTAWVARAAIFSAAYTGFREGRQQERLKSSIVIFGGVFSLLVLLQWYTGGGTVFWIIETRYKSEVAGTFANRDQYAALMELLLPVALAASLSHRRSPILPATCAGLMFASVIASASRAGTVIVCVEALIFLMAASFSRRNFRAVGLISASLILCTLLGGWSYVWERFSYSDPFEYRREMLTATIAMIRARPLTGFGLGAWPSVYPAFAVFDPPGVYMNHAHNDWAEWTADGGLPLLGLLAIFGGALALRTRKNPWTLGIPAVLAHALLDFPLHKSAIACALFLLAGASLNHRRNIVTPVLRNSREITTAKSLLQV
ncbi:MAG: O-antigen ligase family protein [Bryobacteraceae bacterium]